jgi:hypothetical protein
MEYRAPPQRASGKLAMRDRGDLATLNGDAQRGRIERLMRICKTTIFPEKNAVTAR